MSLTIQTLKYQETENAILQYLIDNYEFLRGMTIIEGVGGKATVNGIDVASTLLKTSDCVLDSVDTELVAKEVELNYYNLAFPVTDCELKRTWLSAFARKYRSEDEVYVEALVPYLVEKLAVEVRAQVHADIIAEATADADVTKVTLAGTVATPANAYATVLEFIDGLPAGFVADALDKYSYKFYGIDVSPEAYKNLRVHLADKGGAYSVGGFAIAANKSLSGNAMVARAFRNDVLFVDDAADMTDIKIVEKPWLSTNYILSGMAFKGSYIRSDQIVISN